jgi:transcriptional regulator with XRE-family HTH domain
MHYMTHDRPSPARPWYELVNRERALRGWSKTELSDRSGVARTTIDNWSTNPRTPTAEAVNAVADVLGVDRARAHVLAGIVASAASEPGPHPHVPPDVADYVRRRWRRDPAEAEAVLSDLEAAFSRRPRPAQPPGEDGRESRRAV